MKPNTKKVSYVRPIGSRLGGGEGTGYLDLGERDTNVTQSVTQM